MKYSKLTSTQARSVLLISIFLMAGGIAQAENRSPLEAADTSSPRATLASFFEGWQNVYNHLIRFGEYHESASGQQAARRVADCLDTSQIAPAVRKSAQAKAAVCLKEVLDRIELPSEVDIPDTPQIKTEAGTDELDRWTIPNTEIAIARVKEGPREGAYLFSSDTVERAAEFFHRAEHLDYRHPDATPGIYEWYLSDAGWMISDAWIHSLPNWTRHGYWETPAWKWVGLLATLVVTLVVMLLTYRLGRRMTRAVRETSVTGYLVTLLFPIAATLAPQIAKYFVTEQLKLRGTVHNLVIVLLDIVFLLALMVVVMGAVNRVAAVIIAQPRIHPKGLDAQFIRVTCRLLGLVAAVVIFLEGGKQLGIPITTLLAGAGVGGLAFALAAQDTLKNLFGSMMIFLDKPYRVGERIVTKGYDGVVEEIGLRSTKIRLLTGHQVSIPNEDMARSDIENIGRRPHIRRIVDIALPLDTSPDKAQQAVDIIRGLLENHEGLAPGFPPRVFLTDLNRDSLNLRMIYWYHPPNYWDFLAFGQDLNLRIKREFAAAEIQFALPATTTIMAQDIQQPFEFKVVGDGQSADSSCASPMSDEPDV